MSDVHVHLVRHGQSEWNVIGRLQGQTAHPALTELGRRQSAAAAEQLATLVRGRTTLWSSDLVRARETAAIIGSRLQLPTHEDAALREQALGRFEGTPTSARSLPTVVDDMHPADVRWGDGESSADVYERVHAFLGRVLVDAVDHLVLVTHGDTIRVALAALGGRTHRELDAALPDNGSVTTVTVHRR